VQIVLTSKPAVDRHLAQLRHLDNAILVGPARERLDHVLDLHQITVEPSERDYWRGECIPLRYPLSLLDDEERRSRVSKISFDVSAAIGQGLLPSAEPTT
jgi:hypothetical protein